MGQQHRHFDRRPVLATVQVKFFNLVDFVYKILVRGLVVVQPGKSMPFKDRLFPAKVGVGIIYQIIDNTSRYASRNMAVMVLKKPVCQFNQAFVIIIERRNPDAQAIIPMNMGHGRASTCFCFMVWLCFSGMTAD
jgi:hypothetical protein